MSTVWPGGGGGAAAPLLRRGRPRVGRDFSSRSRRSETRMISAAPFCSRSSCSSTGRKEAIVEASIRFWAAAVADGLCFRRTQVEALIWRDAEGSSVAARELQIYGRFFL